METILFYTAVGFVIGVVFFVKVFSRRTRWDWGIFLAVLLNIPNLIFLSYINSSGTGGDLFVLVAFGLVQSLGGGGFGLGAMVGMLFVMVQARRRAKRRGDSGGPSLEA